MYKHLKAFWKSQGIDEDEYLGNMWGWKVSYIGLVLIVLLLALYFYRITFYPQEIEADVAPQTEILLQDNRNSQD